MRTITVQQRSNALVARHRLAGDTAGPDGGDPRSSRCTRPGRRALVFGLAGLLLTAVMHRDVVAVSGSVVLLGDTLHNGADTLTAVPLMIAFGLGRRPANLRYTYGYGRRKSSPACSSSP